MTEDESVFPQHDMIQRIVRRTLAAQLLKPGRAHTYKIEPSWDHIMYVADKITDILVVHNAFAYQQSQQSNNVLDK